MKDPTGRSVSVSEWRDKFIEGKFHSSYEEPYEQIARRHERQRNIPGARLDNELDEYVMWCDECNTYTPFYEYDQDNLIDGGRVLCTACAVCEMQ